MPLAEKRAKIRNISVKRPANMVYVLNICNLSEKIR